MATLELDIPTPAWAEPTLRPARYKGYKGGRSSGKSHHVAECVVEDMIADPDLRVVCIREVQRSLRYSAKTLIESKIRRLGAAHLFRVLEREIRRIGGEGVCIFEGMQDHTADSIKSLEGFKRAWVEEAQSLSKRSIDLLLPTIRADGSEIWFTWNPEQPDDPVDSLFQDLAGSAFPKSSGFAEGDNFTLVHVNYAENPWCPQVSIEEAKRQLLVDPEAYAHIWLGEYNMHSDAQVLKGKWRVDEFEPGADWLGPYHGADWGFANDPTVCTRLWIHNNRLFVEYESYAVGLELDDTADRWKEDIPRVERYVVRADNARPESISHVRRKGIPKLIAAPKWSGSVEDGIAHLRSYDEIVIHRRCTHAQDEARHYSYKVDKHTGDILPEVVDAHNHCIDTWRYALAPMIKQRKRRHYPSTSQVTV